MYKYQRNSYAFHDINEDSAYWLGFLYTDGYINEDRSSLQLKLSDEESIIAFKEFIEYEGPVQIVNEKRGEKVFIEYQISFIDHVMVNQLIRLGCIPNKTFKLQFPTDKQLPQKYMSCFIRGVFDGDGGVSLKKLKNKGMSFEITGTEQFLIGIRNVLVKQGILGNKRSYIYASHSKNQIIKRIVSSKKSSVSGLYEYLYSNNPTYYMKRKKEKYEALMDYVGIQYEKR